jgi:hypothetical protein
MLQRSMFAGSTSCAIASLRMAHNVPRGEPARTPAHGRRTWRRCAAPRHLCRASLVQVEHSEITRAASSRKRSTCGAYPCGRVAGIGRFELRDPEKECAIECDAQRVEMREQSELGCGGRTPPSQQIESPRIEASRSGLPALQRSGRGIRPLRAGAPSSRSAVTDSCARKAGTTTESAIDDPLVILHARVVQAFAPLRALPSMRASAHARWAGG